MEWHRIRRLGLDELLGFAISFVHSDGFSSFGEVDCHLSKDDLLDEGGVSLVGDVNERWTLIVRRIRACR